MRDSKDNGKHYSTVFHIARFTDLETAEDKIGYFSEDAIEESEYHELNIEESIE